MTKRKQKINGELDYMRGTQSRAEVILHKREMRAPLYIQINFPLLYANVSDTAPVAVSIKILMLSVISLSLAAAR